MKKQRSLFLTALLLFAVLTGCASGAAPETAELSAAGVEFTDIAGHPLEDRILEGLERGLYAVPADGLFRPDEPASFGDFILALWNLSGRPGDSKASAEAQRAADWAAGAGLVNPASYAPDKPMTRQEAMSILYAHNGAVSGVEAMLTGIYDDGFLDSNQISPGGKQALYWGFYNVLIREPEPDIIDPSGAVSRGDMADILIRYMDAFQSESPEN